MTDEHRAAEGPTGRQLVLCSGSTTAVITGVGATLRTLRSGGRDLISGFSAEEQVPYCRGQLLLPWPNRIADGRYTFAGAQQQLPITEPSRSCALHGLTCWREWTVSEVESDRAVLTHSIHPQPGYPFLLDLTVAYQAHPHGLDVTVHARNAGHHPAPFGFGAHPYVTAGTGAVDTLLLKLGASTVLTTDDRLVPTGECPVEGTRWDFRTEGPLDGVVLDDAFTDIPRHDDGRIWASVCAGGETTSVWGDASCCWWQVCTGDEAIGTWHRNGVALEPMTCPPNAFSSGRDIMILAPGQTRDVAWGITDSPPPARP